MYLRFEFEMPFLATTQYGRRGAFPGFQMKHRIKSPNPALSIPRRNEAVATDTVYVGMTTQTGVAKLF